MDDVKNMVHPKTEVTNNAFKITLPNINYAGDRKVLPTAPVKVKGKADRQEIILQLVKKQGYIARKDVESGLNVSQSTAILLLRDMVESGLLIKVKEGKQIKYRIAE
jgi:ATP-dependent DNA helicase RecG